MLPTIESLRERLRLVITDKQEQGHITEGLPEQLAAIPDAYDPLAEFARRLADLPMRPDWRYDEPDDFEAICARWDDPAADPGSVDVDDAAARAEAAFLGRVCGCILGKPVEFDPTLDELRAALEPLGEWPLRDYFPEAAIPRLRAPQLQWPDTVRERIRFVAQDDDINYTIIGMLMLESFGTGFTKENLRDVWMMQLPIIATFGPERTMLARAALNSLEGGDPSALDEWVRVANPRDEWCGALIRADAYGYGCMGRPALAAELAWRDASWTHRRTGTYATMFVAAAIASAPGAREPLDMFRAGLRYVPTKSRFHEITAALLDEVSRAHDWLDGYERVRALTPGMTHCRIYQEVGTLANTLRFASDVGDGICKQVSQGNDTDSFGATAGSMLGAFFGPGHLEARWLAPFNDEIRVALALFPERSLSALTARIGRLPARIAGDLKA
ncbi:MAG: ADP-ribosylglycohydrolase family protein [Actinomycetota bacterium]